MFPIAGQEQLDALVAIGVQIGHSQAHGVVAGRCLAARAAAISRIRREKLYKLCCVDWGEFCRKYLKISKTEADRIIRDFEEFGPAYFEVSALTRISPEVFRAIQPAVKDGALHYNGEAIELTEENSEQVATAVAGLRAALPKPEPQPLSVPEQLEALERRCTKIVGEFLALAKNERSAEHWRLMLATLEKCQSAMLDLDLNDVSEVQA